MKQQHNQHFLRIDCKTLKIARYEGRKYTGEKAQLDPYSDENYAMYKSSIEHYRLMGDNQ